MLSRRVDLPSGGYLMIDYAEALTVIDVNSGSFTGRGKGRLEDTITKVNVEAAEEVVRQLRLRDIGGIIVVDFIDMAKARNRDQVLKTMRKALDEDKTKTYVVEVSPLGLVEMTRQNITDGVREILTKLCPTCEGEGVVESEDTVAIDVLRHLRELVADDPEARGVPDPGQPEGRAQAARPRQSGLRELEEETGKHFHFEGGDALPIGTYQVAEEGSREEIERQALPFEVGDEVLVSIEEPHMYNVDDAVARVDSYVVSVTRGRRTTSASAAWCGSRRSAARSRPRPCSTGQRRRRRTTPRSRRIRPWRAAPGRRGGRRRSRQPAARRTMADNRTRSSRPAASSTAPRRARPCSSSACADDEGAKVSAAAGDVPRPTRTSSRPATDLEKVKVEAVVAEHVRGEKIRVFKYKAKKGYAQRQGHRQELTRLEVTEVKLLTRKPAAKKTEAKPRPPRQAEAAAEEARREEAGGEEARRRRSRQRGEEAGGEEAGREEAAAKKPAAKKTSTTKKES